MLAGKANTYVCQHEGAGRCRGTGRWVVGCSLIIMPDAALRWHGAGIKEPLPAVIRFLSTKHKAPYSDRIQAAGSRPSITTYAMTFLTVRGGISRRRVIFNFTEVVRKQTRHTSAEKIEGGVGRGDSPPAARFADQG